MAPDLHSALPGWPRLNRFLMAAPVVCSLLAAAIVLGNVAAGAKAEPDENAWAHLFQLLIAGQLPLVLLFAATADWARPAKPLTALLVQALAGLAALGALAWSGY